MGKWEMESENSLSELDSSDVNTIHFQWKISDNSENGATRLEE